MKHEALKAIPAGIMICIAAIVYITCPDSIVGAFLFSLGLLTICRYRMNLYTGAVGYALRPKGILKLKEACRLLYILYGNIVGVLIAACIYKGTRMAAVTHERVSALVHAKFADSWYSLLLLGIGCGVLMFIAVNSYREESSTMLEKSLFVILCVVVFILAGFEHSIADFAYICIEKTAYVSGSFKVLGMTVAGNAIGAIGACLMYDKFIKKEETCI